MFKIQSHAMFFDTSHNSLSTVKLNIYTAFVETATKMWSYARCLPTKKRPSMRLVISKGIPSVECINHANAQHHRSDTVRERSRIPPAKRQGTEDKQQGVYLCREQNAG